MPQNRRHLRESPKGLRDRAWTPNPEVPPEVPGLQVQVLSPPRKKVQQQPKDFDNFNGSPGGSSGVPQWNNDGKMTFIRGL